MKYLALENLSKPCDNIIKDQRVALQGKHSGMVMRRVEVNHDWQVMVFITNNHHDETMGWLISEFHRAPDYLTAI